MRGRAAPAWSKADEDRLIASLSEEWPLLLSEPVPPALARTHIAMAATATSPAVPAVAPSTPLVPLPVRRRRRFALAAVTSTFVGQLLLGTAAVAAVGAGAAAAGVLPPPLQSAVSEVAGTVGLELPSGTSSATPAVPADPGDPGEGATPATPAVPAVPVPPENAPDFGLSQRPVTPAVPATPPDPAPGSLGETLRAVRAVPASAAGDHGPEWAGQGLPEQAPDGVPTPP